MLLLAELLEACNSTAGVCCCGGEAPAAASLTLGDCGFELGGEMMIFLPMSIRTAAISYCDSIGSFLMTVAVASAPVAEVTVSVAAFLVLLFRLVVLLLLFVLVLELMMVAVEGADDEQDVVLTTASVAVLLPLKLLALMFSIGITDTEFASR